MTDRLFDDSFRQSLDRLAAAVRRLQVTARRPMVRGSGQSFADHRDYVPGDDTRYIDWSVFGRLGKLVLRVFESEAEPQVYLLTDRSRSMAVGRPARFDTARRLSVALGYVLLSLGAHVGWAGVAGDLVDELPPVTGCGSAAAVMAELAGRTAEAPRCDWPQAARRLAHGHRRRGLVLLLGDLFDDPEPLEQALAQLAYARYATLALQLVLPEEADPPYRHAVRLHDVESGRHSRLRLSPAVLRAYTEVFDEHRRRLDEAARRHGGTFVSLRCDEPIEEMVLGLFRHGSVQLAPPSR